jgi:endonuclease/exonuclease/phosphatase family metal-dependent hydrolase
MQNNKIANLSSIQIITWNVWFDPFEQTKRYQTIFDTCYNLNVDVICFQEVIPSFINQLLNHPLSSQYTLSDTNGETVNPYGVLTLCKTNLNPKFQFHKLPTHMGRMLLTATIQSQNEAITIGNIHLESLNFHRIREQQLGISYNILRRYNFSILCGDFNFCSNRNYFLNSHPLENDSLYKIMIDYRDLWLDMKAEEKGFTFDSTVNKMLSQHETMRYDRIIYRVKGYRPIELMDSTKDPVESITEASPFQEDQMIARKITQVPLNFNMIPQNSWRPNAIEIIGNRPIYDDRVTNLEPTGSDPIVAEGNDGNQAMSNSSFVHEIKSSSNLKLDVESSPMNTVIFPSDHFGLFARFVRN